MLSIVDLKDFAEICRALEDCVASGGGLQGPNGPPRRTRVRTSARVAEDAWIADGVPPAHRFYRKAGGLE